MGKQTHNKESYTTHHKRSMRRATTLRVMNARLGGQQAARLLGGCRSASIWRSDKTKDSIVSDPVQDLNPQSTREKTFADEDTRPTSTLSQDTAAGVAPR